MGQKRTLTIGNLSIYATLITVAFIVFIPLLIIVFASFKTMVQIGGEFPLKPPLHFLNIENYKVAFIKGKIPTGFRNSMILVIITVVINSLIGSMTAYCLSRFRFKFKKVIMGLFVLGMLVPTYISEISRFGIMKYIGTYDTYMAPIIMYAATDLMQIYIYMQFLEKISESLDESAMIDGSTYFGVFFKIIFPLLLPATATLAILKSVDVLNDMFIPLLYMPSAHLRTLTTTLMDFSSAKFGTWQNLSAAIILVMIPAIIIFLLFQKYVFAGIVAGAVKE